MLENRSFDWLLGKLYDIRQLRKAQINKTDRNDARGIAQMIRVGLYRPVHVKTLRSQKLRMLLWIGVAGCDRRSESAHARRPYRHGIYSSEQALWRDTCDARSP
jgi:hypothetical protein